VEAVGASLSGQPICPTIHDKAAFYATRIIQDHIFMDGNKRTGMLCALRFLLSNGRALSPSLTDEAIVELASGLACREKGLVDAVEFFRAHCPLQ
jgi:death-on-curing protein